jgi:monovalent cation:H+ antiporter-2, CPA2 family
MENGSLFILMSVVIFSFLIPIILDRLRWRLIPVVVVEIIFGILLGKSGLGYIQDDIWLNLLSTLGFMYLMFISGLEIDFDAFKSTSGTGGPKPLWISIVTFVLILLVSSVFGFLLFSLGVAQDAIFMTLLISTISLSIVVPTLKDRGITQTPYGQSILLTAVISDFVTMILLGVYVAFHSENMTKPLLLLILFVVVFFLYRFIKHFDAGSIIRKISKESVQLGTRGVFALILFFVVLAQKVGTESILGAFLAGILVSLLSPRKEFVNQLTSFGFGFLIPIFFVMVGAKLQLNGLLHDQNVFIILPLIISSFYVSKFVPVLMWKKWFGWKETLGAGLLLPSTLSLIVAGTAIGVDLKVISSTTQATLILSAVISCIVSPILFQRFSPQESVDGIKKVSLIGTNSISFALANDLSQSGYGVKIFTNDEIGPNNIHSFPILPLSLMPGKESEHVLNSDYMLCLTHDEQLNINVANWGKEHHIPTVICRLLNEDPDQLAEGIHVFSPYRSGKILLRALIEFPSLINFLETGQPLKEIKVENKTFDHRLIKDLELLGDALIIRIFRAEDIIVPHGDTRIKVGDILLISGEEDLLNEIKTKLSK